MTMTAALTLVQVVARPLKFSRTCAYICSVWQMPQIAWSFLEHWRWIWHSEPLNTQLDTSSSLQWHHLLWAYMSISPTPIQLWPLISIAIFAVSVIVEKLSFSNLKRAWRLDELCENVRLDLLEMELKRTSKHIIAISTGHSTRWYKIPLHLLKMNIKKVNNNT